jgi:hypothetical protein
MIAEDLIAKDLIAKDLGRHRSAPFVMRGASLAWPASPFSAISDNGWSNCEIRLIDSEKFSA